MSDSDSSYLVVVDYEEDTERKRAEYLLDNWEEGTVSSVRGLTRLVSDTDIHDLYEALVSKVPEERISTYELSAVEETAPTTDANLQYRLQADPERADWAMESVLNKRKAVDDPKGERTYAIYTKKGRAEVSYDITERGDEILLDIEIEGYGEATEFLREYFQEELEYML